PDREPDLLELAHVAAARVNDETADASRLVRRREQLAEHPVGIRRTQGDDDDIARPSELDSDVQHPVVTGVSQNRHRVPGHACAGVNRPHIRVQETGSALRFVNGGDAELCEGVDDLERSAVDVAYGYLLQLGISHLWTAGCLVRSGPCSRIRTGRTV